ncbi:MULTISPECIES: transketolase [Caldilinea]|jgi:transketolase|uniref:Transketolase n=1 Tax=Caldilinea aerophila (strain DSM 14535 / JCM 11387 / NBRC 104270 / STL-6-O1) TaxID=926550 RepID=I0I4I2_CALAS|nr:MULTISPECIES: transketolase [Caldilinea]BAM00170.1 transketolase [Caldilinea aerophila DSM 14535 = NBRC 104270]GIV71529.1 MAG: transketolase [Caldilinea sp.]
MDTVTVPSLDKPLSREFEIKAANTIRMLAADAVQAANSGHPGMPMGMAVAALTLWTRVMRYNPRNPHWFDRDRFVLSAGHGSMLLYAMLHLTGYDLPLEELKNFRQWGSKTPGHPEARHTPGVETTTGPLGQGFANGVGMAIAERWLAQRFNRPGFDVINHYTYAIVSDGDLMEGVASEAASLAGHLRLGKLIYLYDDNSVTIDGKTEITYTEDWAKRFEAYGWHVQRDVEFTNSAAIYDAIITAQNDPRPSIIGLKSIIGYGSPNKAGTSKVHGEPLGEEELKATKENLGWPLEPRFYIPEDVLAYFRQAVERGRMLEDAHQQLMAAYADAYPDLAAELQRFIRGELPEGWEEVLPVFPPSAKGDATRNSSGKVINALAPVLPNLIGGSADLAASNKTTISGAPFMKPGDFGGPNIHFGVREHGMGGILNGMALHGGVLPFGGTFLVFSDYMRGAIRLAALSGLRVIYVFTHDSIGLGEDGPTHQPIEHLAALRAMPNLTVIRPADANETSQAWRAALLNANGPTALALTRQNVPIYDREGEGLGAAEELLKGGYVFYEHAPNGLQVVLIGTGSEVQIAYDAARQLAAEGVGVRVVSLPSWELFQAQPADYRAAVLPPDLPKVAIEAAATFGWERWVGNDPRKGVIIGVDRFGASAPYQRIYKEFGLTVERVVDVARRLINGQGQ